MGIPDLASVEISIASSASVTDVNVTSTCLPVESIQAAKAKFSSLLKQTRFDVWLTESSKKRKNNVD